MQAVFEREVLLERRQYTPQQSNLWDKLSLAQKFSSNSLTQFGYDLSFIRHSKSGNLAIFLCDNNAATIADDGEISTLVSIVIRA